MIKVSEHLPDMGIAGFVQPGEEKVQGDLTGVYKLPDEWDVKKTEPDSSQQCPRKRGNGHKQKYQKFHVSIRKTLFVQ